MPSADQYAVLAFGGVPRKLVSGVKSPDGRRIAIVSGDTIYAQSVDGRKRVRLTTILQPHSLSWSPDGLQIAFVSGNIHYVTSPHLANIAPSSICVMTVSDGVVSQITDNTSLNLSPAWANDGRRLFFVSSRDGARDVYSVAINRSGLTAGMAERLTTGLNAHEISLSTDMKALAYAALTYTSNIWSIPIPEGNPISSKDARPVTTGNQVIENLAISPDGQWLAYDSNRPGNQDIFKVMVKGGEPIQLTTDPSDDFVPSWSPDGKMIAFHSFRNGNRDIFVMLDDGTQQQQITHDPAQEWYPDWSPDGNQLVFSSDRSGRLELYIVSNKAGSTEWEFPRQLTLEGGAVPRWSPDGTWIAYVGNGISVISPKGGAPRVLVSWEGPARWPERGGFVGWSRDGRTVYYSAVENSRNLSWWAVPVNGGKPRLLVMGDDRTSGSNAGFATDGKTIFFTISNYESDIWKMELLRNE
jgi:Tol biopolymer transport system component